jgi:hypothetical protein
MKLVISVFEHPYIFHMLLNPSFRFFYYTAGTGGAGPTILATSFLLLGEDVIAYNKGTSSLCTSAIAPMEFLTVRENYTSFLFVLLIQEKKSN